MFNLQQNRNYDASNDFFGAIGPQQIILILIIVLLLFGGRKIQN